MKSKLTLIATLALGICSLALAGEKYSGPEFKKTAPPATEVKPVVFEDDYKVEGPVKTDRQIASEEESEREPSSISAVIETKKEVNYEQDVAEPQPWTYNKNKKQKDWFDKGLEK